MAKGPRRLPAKSSPFEAANFVATAQFTVGTSSGNVCNVAVQLGDANFNALDGIGHVRAYLSDSADGHTLSGTTPNGSVAIGTNGVVLVQDVSKLLFQIISNSTGEFDLNIGDSAGHTWYLVVLLPDGSIAVSPAITV